MTRVPIVVSDPNQADNPIVFVNPAFCELTHYADADIVGKNCRVLQGDDTDPEAVAALRRAVCENRSVAVDILNYKADGHPFWNAVFIGPIHDAGGRVLYWFGSMMDITSRKFGEQALLQAQKMEVLGQLTAGVAHDFNNLLQVVAGNLDLVRTIPGSPAAALLAVERAALAVRKAGKLTNQLLTFARKQHLKPLRLNMNGLVVEFSEMLARTLGSKIDLELALQPGLPSCQLDPAQMEMALLNVLVNARDAMPDGGKVVLATSMLPTGTRFGGQERLRAPHVMISVADQGAGMTPDTLGRAREPFFTTKATGTGLGLAMVHGFAQQSGGWLDIQSEVGKGTAIRMAFPVALHGGGDSDQRSGARADGWTPIHAMGMRTVLLVDGIAPDARDVMETYLRRFGYRVLGAAGIDQAVALADGHGRIDLLVASLTLDDGGDAMRLVDALRLRQPDMPAIFGVDFASAASLAAAAAASDAQSIARSSRMGQLAERVRVALKVDVRAAAEPEARGQEP
ncbi:PAS domain-containing protein [Massilia forsythiae]|uniref:histidine kinase n=2 Tax=Massilia forsythiae TaxID=2728020 RepID=A0A7Z2ZTY7_9BURK|nr:PAS domain-containing protein [Massilia forsythiae]